MYKRLLILRYFQRKLVAVFALLAVTLCTAMVIIVISVMGGFLDMLTHTAKTLSGDVVIHRGLGGFPHYESMLEGLKQLPEVAGATTTVHGFGLLKLHGYILPVQVIGIRPQEFNTVTNYRGTLHWTSEHFLDHDAASSLGPWLQPLIERTRPWFQHHHLRDVSMQFKLPPAWQCENGMVPGIAVSPANKRRRTQKGQNRLWELSVGSAATLTIMPITSKGVTLEPEVDDFTVVNEFKSGFMEIDHRTVYVPFKRLQQMLNLHETAVGDPVTGQPTGDTVPARTTEMIVRSAKGYDLDQTHTAVQRFVDQFTQDHDLAPPVVLTWLEDRWGTILAAVKKEKVMMAFLFGVISLVAVVMVAVIFYMIVMEKTRDIGVLRAIGAARSGIATVFLGYALAVGVVGATAGFLLAALVVWNLNEIQDWLTNSVGVSLFYTAIGLIGLIIGGVVGARIGQARGRVRTSVAMGVLAGVTAGLIAATICLRKAAELGPWLNRSLSFTMWDPQVYYFDRIPARLDAQEVSIILVSTIIASVIGALLPAWLASRTNPVEALRYE